MVEFVQYVSFRLQLLNESLHIDSWPSWATSLISFFLLSFRFLTSFYSHFYLLSEITHWDCVVWVGRFKQFQKFMLIKACVDLSRNFVIIFANSK